VVRELLPAEHDGDLLDLRCRAFGAVGDQEVWHARADLAKRDRRYLGVFDGTRLVGSGLYHDMTQWWNGREVRMAGVASVTVAPEARGRGVGRSLMTAMLGAIAARGYPLSALFPSTLPLYRSLGWEIAGTTHEAMFDAHALRSLTGTPASAGGSASGGAGRPGSGVWRAGPADAGRVREVLALAHGTARDRGPNLRDEASVGLWLGRDNIYCYLAGDGVLCCTWGHGHDQFIVLTAVAASAVTTRRLWEVVASHCWVADRVRARIGPADPIWWLTRDPISYLVDHDDWMLRVVDPAAAIAGRGFPPGTELSVPLRITDTALPGNTGTWLLEVAGGRGTLSRIDGDGKPGLVLDVRGLAALYAGTPTATLRRAGLASGDPAADPLLDGAFCGPAFMIDQF
jgi:predicted acetyltransferase